MAGVSQEIARVRARISGLPAAIAKQGGDTMRAALLDAARRDTGGDLRLSRVWWQSFDLDVSVTINGQSENSTALLAPAPLRGGAAIWSWLEFGTKAHRIGISKKGRRKHMRINGDWVTGPIQVRGMPAKRTWSRGVEAGAPDVIRMADKLFGEAVRGG